VGKRIVGLKGVLLMYIRKSSQTCVAYLLPPTP